MGKKGTSKRSVGDGKPRTGKAVNSASKSTIKPVKTKGAKSVPSALDKRAAKARPPDKTDWLESPTDTQAASDHSVAQDNSRTKNSSLTERPKGLKNKTFPIIGVGASAGGLEAFKRLLSRLPADTGMGIVFIQHLNPTHPSQLSEVLSTSTKMRVVEAENGARVQPNQVYVIPPNANLAIMHGILHMMPPEDGRHMTIDYFFRSLAQDQGSRAIGVVLSGSNSDGALGLQAIKAEGGITLVQDEASAQYTTMPRSAVSAAAVDFILPPEDIADELARIGQHPYVSRSEPSAVETGVKVDGTDLQRIFILLRTRTGVDFSYYKQTTVRRRIMRRMALLKIGGLGKYAKYLQETPAEVSALYEDMLINVTNFFRDPEAFEALKTKVFPRLMADRPLDTPLRMWVAGCATGEEAYSLAICLIEYLGDQADNTPIQIFTTDVSDKVIDKARAGVYPENISLDVSPERLKRFFMKVESGYQIIKTIRDMCIFSRQNLIKDPPFSRLDLISCRNVLIYMDAALQKKIIPVFHYALNPGGFLVLGNAETVGSHTDLFSAEDRKHKIYTKKSVDSHPDFGFAVPAQTGKAEALPVPATEEARRNFNLQRESERIILNRYGPVGVVINSNMEIVLFRGHTGVFLESAPGEVNLNIFSMAREGLMPELRTAIFESRNRNLPIRRDGLRIKSHDALKSISLQVHPMNGPGARDAYFLVLFEDTGYVEGFDGPKKRGKSGKTKQGTEPDSAQVVQLREELVATKEYLESVIAQHQATNEELKSANEEIQSSNEELQSINEELETAKEELQATNEELTTVNDELQNRNAELGQANDDLINLLSNINVPVVMLGRDLRIRRFTPTAEKILHLIPSDIGRSINDLKLNIDVANLPQLTSEVIDSLVPKELEIRDQQGGSFHLRIRPYKTMDNRIGGAVLVWIDMTGVKPGSVAPIDSLALSRAIAGSITDPVLVLDSDLKIKLAGDALYKSLKLSPGQALGRSLQQLGAPPWNLPDLHKFLTENSLPNDKPSTIAIEYRDAQNGKKKAVFRALPVGEDGATKLIVLVLAQS